VDVDQLGNVGHLGLHVRQLGLLEVEHLQKVAGERVDLVGDARKALDGVVLRLDELGRLCLLGRLRKARGRSENSNVKTLQSSSSIPVILPLFKQC
jgi:hypothetical protein